MDAAGMAAGAPIPPPDSSPPPYAGQGTGAAFPISIVIAIGFMVTSLILISYYFLVVRCWLRGGGPGTGLLHRARRDDDRHHLPERVSAVFFTDHDDAELPAGLDPDVVAALPVVRYRRRASASSSSSECAVCLGEFAPGERLKQLPSCSHAFHIDCIDTWLHHNVSCPLCRTVVTGTGGVLLARDDHDASCRDLQHLGDARHIIDAAGRVVGYGSSCRFPTKTGAAGQEPITRSFSMDCFAGGLGRKPQTKEPPAASSSSGEAGPSLATSAGSSNVADRGAGETSGRFRRLLSSFGLGRSSRSTVLPIHLDP